MEHPKSRSNTARATTPVRNNKHTPATPIVIAAGAIFIC